MKFEKRKLFNGTCRIVLRTILFPFSLLMKLLDFLLCVPVWIVLTMIFVHRGGKIRSPIYMDAFNAFFSGFWKFSSNRFTSERN